MIDFWNQRYAEKDYAYGENPNHFFEKELRNLKPGTILFPAEGEGRNAVHAAKKGWKSHAFDTSIEGKNKAEKLAEKNGVNINYQVSDFDNFRPEVQYDCIVLTFAHSGPAMRISNHQLVKKWLKPGGKIILQAFSKKQLGKISGGPQNIDFLFSIDDLQNDFKGLRIEKIEEVDTVLDEGKYHIGPASVINLTATKP